MNGSRLNVITCLLAKKSTLHLQGQGRRDSSGGEYLLCKCGDLSITPRSRVKSRSPGTGKHTYNLSAGAEAEIGRCLGLSGEQA